MSSIYSEDIELSQEERITLAYARWNKEILPKQNSLVNMEYQVVLFGIGSMVERLLLHTISNFKDLVLTPEEEAAIRDWLLRACPLG